MRRLIVPLMLILLGLASPSASAQEVADAGSQQQQPSLDAGQLDQLVAPIALYPDPLLAQVLMASTYPLEIVQGDRWRKANKGLKGDKLTEALANQDWDPSVKELASTPTVLDMMNDQLDWTQKLGDAVLAQQADVMDAIQRLRTKAQANGKLETTKQQKVSVKQEPESAAPIIEIQPASSEVVYVPYYDPAVVYGEWTYPEYPPYYYPPPGGYIVGGAIATGLAWGAAYAIGREVWNDIDWRHGNIDIDRNVNIDVDRNFTKWEHNSYHRRGVSYNNADVKNKFAKANINAGDRNFDFRGHGGNQVLKPGSGDRPNLGGGDRPGGKPGGADRSNLGGGDRPGGKPGGADRPNLGGGERPGGKPDVGQIQQGLKERSDKQAALPGQKPDRSKAKPKGKPGGNAFDPSDGAKAKDFSKRGQASLGNRGTADFARPKGGGRPNVGGGGGGGHIARGGGGRGGGGHIARGGGGRGGGGRGGGGRRSDIRLKEDIVPLMQLGNGLELYRFRYMGSDHTVYVGVMAQEVQKVDPSAVSHDRDGYLMVDYDRIGLKFMTWQEWVEHPVAQGVRP